MNTEYVTLTAATVCAYCGSTLVTGERVAANKSNGEIYGFACHSKFGSKPKRKTSLPALPTRPKLSREEHLARREARIAARKFELNTHDAQKGFVKVLMRTPHTCAHCHHDLPLNKVAWVSKSGQTYHPKRSDCTMADAHQLTADFLKVA